MRTRMVIVGSSGGSVENASWEQAIPVAISSFLPGHLSVTFLPGHEASSDIHQGESGLREATLINTLFSIELSEPKERSRHHPK